ncbi:Elongin-A3 [Hondaea fermentalgiana]|uniref:Elongin-A3 n=1 Tax=Hondaea fermentalgiana TaxID=2315210 RepID=A0A2R5G188_9STRA|nr:Elongin-A3 [Hondaea fermentalgiana]|eukprot:GBG24295.1 Elongin-A3 [Hondaea fermentalgiana]
MTETPGAPVAAPSKPPTQSGGRGGWRGAHVLTKRRALEKRVLDLFSKQPRDTLAKQGTVQWARFEKDSMRIPCVVVPATRLRSKNQLVLAKEALASRRPTVVVFWLVYGSFGKVRVSELIPYSINGPDPNLETTTPGGPPGSATPPPAVPSGATAAPQNDNEPHGALLEKNRAFLDVARAEADAAVENPLAYVDRLNVLSTSVADESEDAVSTRSGRSSIATRRVLPPTYAARPASSGPLHGVDPFEPDYADRLGAHLARRQQLQHHQHNNASCDPTAPAAVNITVHGPAAADAHAFEDARDLANAQASRRDVDDPVASEGASENIEDSNGAESDGSTSSGDMNDSDDDFDAGDSSEDIEDEYLPADDDAQNPDATASPPAPGEKAAKRPKPDPQTSDAISPDEALKRLAKTKKKLEVFADHPELAINEQAVNKAVQLLKDLAAFPITESLLRESAIGPAIANLRNHEHSQVKSYARGLRSVWKETLLAQRESA